MGRTLLVIVIAVVLSGCIFGSPDEPTTCPTTYNVALVSSPGSKYRIITSDAVFQSQHLACDRGGGGHLISIETEAERLELATVLLLVMPQPTSNWYYTGAVQPRSAAAADAGWTWLTGGELPAGIWGTADTRQQPDDADGNENNGENLAVFDAAQGRLVDVSGSAGFGAVCECDGKAIDAAIEDQLP